MKVLVVDTETTGLCDMRTPYTKETLSSLWPYITQIAYAVYDFEDGKLFPVLFVNSYVKPHYDLSVYDKSAVDITGLTPEFLAQFGIEIKDALDGFIQYLKSVDVVVAHNTTFDMKMIKAECMRNDIEQHMRIVPWLDTVYYGGEFLRKITDSKKRIFPTLSDLYKSLYGEEPRHSHLANDDVMTCAKCFEGLCREGILSEERIKLRIENHHSSEQS